MPEAAQGLVLWYGDTVQIPLYSFFDETPPAPANGADSQAAATPTPAIIPSATPRLDVTPSAAPALSPSPTPALAVPPSDTPAEEEVFESAYEVQPGDTLDMIAIMNGVSLVDLMALNGLTEDTLLQVGTF